MIKSLAAVVTLCLSAIGGMAGCLPYDLREIAYPEVRERLIVGGWKPRHFDNAFTANAPYATWVKDRNYTEVSGCSGTGVAACRFEFTSTKDESRTLFVVTEGESLGVVKDHWCE